MFGAISPLETKRSRGDAGENVEENRSKKGRPRENQNQEEEEEEETENKDQIPEDPEPEEFIDPKGPTTPPSPTAAEWIENTK